MSRKDDKTELDKVFMLIALGQVYPLAGGRGYYCEGVGNVTFEVHKLMQYNRVEPRTRITPTGVLVETVEVRA
jgi:hypothetical protein